MSDSDSQSRPSTPTKKLKIRHEMSKENLKLYAQKFRQEWKSNPNFKGWLEEHKTNKLKCICKACNAELKCGLTDIKRHSTTTKHQCNVKKLERTNPVNNYFQKSTVHNTKVLEAEIKLSNFFAQHNVAFAIVDHLLPLMKEIAPDSPIIKDMQLGRTKVTNVINNVLAKKAKTDIMMELRSKKFSILVDESTDRCLQKLFCIVVKYVNNNGEVCDNILELVTIDAKDASAGKLYEAFKNCLESKQIPVKNVIGLASDNANVMVGSKNSFMTRLKSEVDSLVVIPCICHSSALIASQACSKLPRTPEEFLRNIASYFSMSSKRTAQLEEFQEYFQVETRKMLKVCTTRWLCMQQCVSRVLENWRVLEHYFELAMLEDRSLQVEYIYEQIQNKCTKAYLYFLNYVLKYFNMFNALFQSKKTLVQDLAHESQKLFFQLVAHYIKPEYVNTLKIEYSDPRNFKKIEDIDLGVNCNDYLKQLPNDIQLSIRKKCLEFYISSAVDMKKRLPLNEQFFNSLSFLKPTVALNNRKPDYLQSLSVVAHQFNISNITDIDFEWKQICFHFNNDEEKKEELLNLNIPQFWHYLEAIKNYEDNLIFQNVSQLAKLCLSLPHSNAETERVFSIVTDVKTKKRNKIGATSLNSVVILRNEGKSKGNCCKQFIVSKEHIHAMKAENLYKN